MNDIDQWKLVGIVSIASSVIFITFGVPIIFPLQGHAQATLIPILVNYINPQQDTRIGIIDSYIQHIGNVTKFSLNGNQFYYQVEDPDQLIKPSKSITLNVVTATPFCIISLSFPNGTIIAEPNKIISLDIQTDKKINPVCWTNSTKSQIIDWHLNE